MFLKMVNQADKIQEKKEKETIISVSYSINIISVIQVVEHFTCNAGLSVALSLLMLIPLTFCPPMGRGRTVTKSPPGLSSSTTALGTLRPVSPGSPGTINWT